MSFMDDFEHLKIQLKDIRLATNDFADKPIGIGGFGKVFKGELSLLEGKKVVAFKRLDRKWGQGDTQFWKEIMMLSQYKHENLISLLHFCDEDGERILVYEFASHGSLDSYLGKSSLTWNQLLKICHGVACGLNYLHDPMNHQRVLHRDVKSSNILLDENLTPKVSDFGLSKLGPADQQYTYLVSNVVGTPGYCDPVYLETGSLSKESDVYSFGVVLFEVIIGKHCFEYCNGELKKILVPLWKKLYEEDKIDDIVCNNLKEQMDMDSCKTFLNIAYRCLHKDRKERPTMAEIIKELEIALDHQEMSQDADEKAKYEETICIANQAVTPISYRSRNELALVLSKGIVLEGGYRTFSINKNGEHQEMMLVEKFTPSDNSQDSDRSNDNFLISLNSNFQLEASSRFLSPYVTYNVNLVYKYKFAYKSARVPFKYKLHTEKEYWTSCVAQERTDELLSTKLYQFTSSHREHGFKFDFLGQLRPIRDHDIRIRIRDHDFLKPFKPDRHDRRCTLHVIGIEFVPVELEKDDNLEEGKKVDIQPTIDLDTDWEKKLPSDYDDIIKWSKYKMQWTTNKELYYLLRKGFLTQLYLVRKAWFFASKKMKRCCMLPAKEVLEKRSGLMSLLRRKPWIWKSLPESRFQQMAELCEIKSFTIACYISPLLLSPETHYACYLVYKLPEKHSMTSGLVQVDDENLSYKFYDERDDLLDDREQIIDLLTPTHIPFIGSNAYEPCVQRRARRIKGHPKLRKDGWMEIQVWDFQSGSRNRHIWMHCRVRSYYKLKFTGFLVQGIEFRPAKVSFMTCYR